MFRPGRNPAPPPPRRTVSLRRRHPPPGAQHAGMDHEEHGASLNMPQFLPKSATVEDDQRADGLDIDMMTGRDEQHDGSREEELRGKHRALRWRIGQEPRPDGRNMESQLQAVCGAGAQALWQERDAQVQVGPEDQARALVSALLAINARAGGEGLALATGAATLQLAAVRAYLQKEQEAQKSPEKGPEAGPLATLERVKQALLERRPSTAPQQRAAAPDESQQNRNLLLPLLLLNANRPRTEAQNQQACDRITLACAATGLQGRERP